MQRIRIAWVILFLTILLCAASHFAVLRITQSVQEQLSQTRALAEARDYEGAQRSLRSLQAYYASRQHLLELFRRETVAAVSVNLHGLPAYVNDETIRDLYTEIDKAIEQLRAMEHLFASVF